MELFHIQTNQVFPLLTAHNSAHNSAHNLIKVGKFIQGEAKDINLIDIPDANVVSRIHLYFYIDQTGNHCEIEDQGSSNGTFINGQPLNPFYRQFLNHGDLISLGKENNVSFQFRCQTSSNASSPEPSVTPVPTHLQKTTAQVGNEFNATNTESNYPRSEQTPERTNGDRPLFSIGDLLDNLPPRVNRFLGIGFLIAAIVYFSSIMRIGISFRAYVLILWGAGVYLLLQKNIAKEWGWLLIGIGTVIMLFQARVYAYANLLGIVISAILFGLSYFFFDYSEKK